MDDQTNENLLTLLKPVTVGGKRYDALQLREPVAVELEAASRAASGVGALITLISLTSGAPRGVPEAMASRDLARADAIFKTFSVPPAELGEGDDFVDEVTIPLRMPVALGKGDAATVYDKLELSEPNGAQKDKASRETNDVRAAINLISTVAKVPRVVAERLCQRDFEEACNFLASCNVAGPMTGAIS